MRKAPGSEKRRNLVEGGANTVTRAAVNLQQQQLAIVEGVGAPHQAYWGSRVCAGRNGCVQCSGGLCAP